MPSRHAGAHRPLLPADFRPADLPLPLIVGRHRALLRRLEPGDADRLLAFFHSHSPETVYQRYGYAGVQMTRERASQLVGVDQTLDAALGVFETVDRQPRLIAIGRYCLERDRTSAEVAFVVHEARRGLRLGTTLFAALIAIARERGLERLIARVQHENAAMIAMLRAVGATLAWPSGSSSLEGTLHLRVAPVRRPAVAKPRAGAARRARRIGR